MDKKVYGFKEQFDIGQHGEVYLDKFFQGQGVMVEVREDMTTQRKGIDRYFHIDGRAFGIEYKTDMWTAKTGNLFLEFAWGSRAGWLLTTQADYVAYYAPSDIDTAPDIIYMLKPGVLRQNIPHWLNALKWKTVKNKEYQAYGMLLPHVEAIRVATRVYYLP